MIQIQLVNQYQLMVIDTIDCCWVLVIEGIRFHFRKYFQMLIWMGLIYFEISH
jgi:hypothetical protein